MLHDLRVCLRGLVRAPVLTFTIVATVGLGIGATTVIFAAVNAALLRPLPYAEPDRLVRIYTDAPPNTFPFSVADYRTLTQEQSRFEQITGYAGRPMVFSDGAVAERLRGKTVSPTYFAVLGIPPLIGRSFTELDGRPGSPHAVIVSHGFWQTRLAGRRDAVGRSIRLDGSDYAVVGVLPQLVGPLEQGQDIFVAAQWDAPPRKGPFFITVIGRLRSQRDWAAATEELRAINRRMFPIWKASYQDDKATWSMMDLKAFVVGDAGTTAWVALVAVALVWLIACANASNLLIARVTSRRRELAVRAALGASRRRVVQHLLAESGLLALGAAAIGLAIARAGIGVLRTAGAAYLPRTHEIALDGPVFWVMAAATIASGLLFGLVPALHGTGGPVDECLRSPARSATSSLSVRQLRRLLVGGQFAIATPLLVVAALLLISLDKLGRVDLGFDTRHLLTGSIQLPAQQYQDTARATAFWDELKRRVEAAPGVSVAAFTDGRPPNDVNNFNNFDLEQFPTPPGQSQPVTPWVAVTPDYFRALGIPLLEGRLLDEQDARRPNIESVVVDRAWARRFFPNESVIGKRMKEGGCTTCPWTTVVGVVSEVKYAGLNKPDDGTVYWPMSAGGFRYIVVRAHADPLAVSPAVREALRSLDPAVPLSAVATIDDLIAQSLERPRSVSLLVAGFALVALTLSVVGIYGVMAYYVQQHAKDIGIRLALGGRPAEVLRLIVGQGMMVVSSGVVVGLLGAAAASRLTSSLLFGVTAGDPRTFAAVGGLLVTVALVACLLPARRAIAMEPAAVLRDE